MPAGVAVGRSYQHGKNKQLRLTTQVILEEILNFEGNCMLLVAGIVFLADSFQAFFSAGVN